MKLGFPPDSRRVRVWRGSGQQERLRYVQGVRPYSGIQVMMWAGIIFHHQTVPVFVEGTLNQYQYIDRTLEPVVLPFATAAGPALRYMQDNARSHTAATVRDWFRNENITLLPWPAQSPDLNPIEHVWDVLQRRITPHLHNVHTNQGLQDILTREWNLLPQNEIDNLILSIPRRCRAVVNAAGGNSGY